MNLHQQFAEQLSPLTKHDYGDASYDVCPKNRWKWQKYGEIFLNRDLVSIYVCSACEAAAAAAASSTATSATTTTNKDRAKVISVNGKQQFATGEIREFWRHIQQCHRDVSNVFIANLCKEIELEPVNKKLKVSSNVIVIDDYDHDEEEGEDGISNDNRVCELTSGVQELAANKKAPLQRFEIASSTNEISDGNRQQNKSSVNSENASNTTLIQSEPIITNNQVSSKITKDILMECNEEGEFISEQFYQIENQLREMHREAVDNEALKINDADGLDPTKISNESIESENQRKSLDEICNKNKKSYLNNAISESFVNLSEVIIESHKEAENFRLEGSEDTSDTIEWSLATGEENISDKEISRKGDEVPLEKFGILKSLLTKTKNNNNNNNKINNNNNNDPTIRNKNVSNIIEISDDEYGDNDDGNDNGEKYRNDFLISNNNQVYEKEQIINDATPVMEIIAPELTQSGFSAQENYMDIDEFFKDSTNDYSNDHNDQLSSSYALEIPSNNQKEPIQPVSQNSLHTFNGNYEQSITQVFDNNPQFNQSNNPNQPSTIPMVQIPKDLISDNKEKTLYSERPFKCDKCGVRTCTHRRMKKHMLRQHPSDSENSSGKIQCQHCSQSYKSRGSVKRHMRKAHPEFYKNMTETVTTTNNNAVNNARSTLVDDSTVNISTHDDVDTLLRNASNISSTIKQANSMNFHNSWHMERSLETHWSEGDDSSESIGVLLPANRDSESKLI